MVGATRVFCCCIKAAEPTPFTKVQILTTFLTTFFFQVDQIDFWSSPKALLCPYFWQNFLRRRQILKKNSQKSRFWALFEKFWQKIAFFWRALPSKLVYIGSKVAFRKILGSVGWKWISEKVSKGRQEVESLREGVGVRPPKPAPA